MKIIYIVFLSVFLLNIPVAQAVGNTYIAKTRGTSVTIPYSDIFEWCGDEDGCRVRMGMYNWDGNQQVASRPTMLFLDRDTGNWRTQVGNKEGTTNNGLTEHLMHEWSCYFTDGKFVSWTSTGDLQQDFSLLSWRQFNAEECRLTIVD